MKEHSLSIDFHRSTNYGPYFLTDTDNGSLLTQSVPGLHAPSSSSPFPPGPPADASHHTGCTARGSRGRRLLKRKRRETNDAITRVAYKTLEFEGENIFHSYNAIRSVVQKASSRHSQFRKINSKDLLR